MYTNVDIPVNDRERKFTIMYPRVVGQLTAQEAEAFGRRLRAARERAGLSLDGLADETECSKAMLSKWEGGGTRSPDYVPLSRVAIRLGTTPAGLLWDAGVDPWVHRRVALTPPTRRRHGRGE